MRIFDTPCIFVFVCASTILEAQAWGPDGHAMIGNIASEYLSSEAKNGVTMILSKEGPGTTMGDVASWADDFKSRNPWSRKLHYADTTNGNTRDMACWDQENGYVNCTYIHDRDCVDNFCISGAISNYTENLQSGITSGDQYSNRTLDSLKFLIHFVGDVSQPLHCGISYDRGGNDVNVTYHVAKQLWPKYAIDDHYTYWPNNLHAVWDSGMILNKKNFLGSRNELQREIKSLMESKWNDEMHKWDEIIDPNKWIQDSFDQAITKAYRFPNGTQIPMREEPVPLTGSYYDKYMCTGCLVELQLAKGAARLANLLNNIDWKNYSGIVN